MNHLRIVNRSRVAVDKEAMRLIVRQHMNLSVIVRVSAWDKEQHGDTTGEYLAKGERVGKRTITNPYGEVILNLTESVTPNLALWYFAHEYRHAMQDHIPYLREAIYNTDRERLITRLCGGRRFTAAMFWKWRDLLPEEVDANCFATMVAGYAHLSPGTVAVADPRFGE